MQNNRPSIAVIGAGMGGLSCARSLHATGFSVSIFDRGRKPGGRMATRDSDLNGEGSVTYDHGAPFIDVRSESFRAQTEQWVQSGFAAWWRPVIEQEDGQSVEHGSVIVGLPSMAAIPEQLSDGLDLTSSCGVIGLEGHGDDWMLTLEHYGHDAPETRPFDLVVLAMPGTQARRLIDPEAISGLAVLKGLQSTTNWAYMMSVCLGAAGSQLPDSIESASGDVLHFAHRKPGRSLPEGVFSVVMHADQEWSLRERETPRDVIAPLLRTRLLHHLAQRLEISADSIEVLDEHAHRWGLARTIESLDEDVVFDAAMGIGYCGDAIGGHDAESAFMSGLRLGEQIAAM